MKLIAKVESKHAEFVAAATTSFLERYKEQGLHTITGEN